MFLKSSHHSLNVFQNFLTYSKQAQKCQCNNPLFKLTKNTTECFLSCYNSLLLNVIQNFLNNNNRDISVVKKSARIVF